MAIPLGKLEKMLILAFDNLKDAAKGGRLEAVKKYEVLINPESYTADYKTEFACGQSPGTSRKEAKFSQILPQQFSFQFLFDNTGLIDFVPKISITKDIEKFRDILFEYIGENHGPRQLKIVWGDFLKQTCVAKDLKIEFKLFNAAGMPIRAVATVNFLSSTDEEMRVALEANASPDLTHVRQVKAGDTLPLMCKRIYGDSRYYLQVAEANGIGNFRRLTPGMEIVFPPIDKTVN